MKTCLKLTLCLVLFISNATWANVVVNIYSTNNPKQSLGTVTADNSPYGLLLKPNLHGLTPGLHGFHVHQNPSCADGGMAAGGHLDPQKTNQHLGPYNSKGHLGDLPALYVNKDGKATEVILAPRLKEADLLGRSLMIHAGGDNYSDTPAKLGGGGKRVACGVITKTEG